MNRAFSHDWLMQSPQSFSSLASRFLPRHSFSRLNSISLLLMSNLFLGTQITANMSLGLLPTELIIRVPVVITMPWDWFPWWKQNLIIYLWLKEDFHFPSRNTKTFFLSLVLFTCLANTKINGTAMFFCLVPPHFILLHSSICSVDLHLGALIGS